MCGASRRSNRRGEEGLSFRGVTGGGSRVREGKEQEGF